MILSDGSARHADDLNWRVNALYCILVALMRCTSSVALNFDNRRVLCLWLRSSAWLECRPVTADVAGSNPVGVAVALPDGSATRRWFCIGGFCCMIVSVAMMKLFIVIDNRIVEAWLRSSVVERLSVEEDVAGSSPVGVALLRIFWELESLS